MDPDAGKQLKWAKEIVITVSFVCYNWAELSGSYKVLQAINPNPKPRAKPWKIKMLPLGVSSQKEKKQLLSHSDYTAHILQLLKDVLQHPEE